MADDGLKWRFEFEAKLGAIDALADRLKTLEARLEGVGKTTGKAEGNTKGATDEMGRLRNRLKELKAPAELKKLTGQIRALEEPPKAAGAEMTKLGTGIDRMSGMATGALKGLGGALIAYLSVRGVMAMVGGVQSLVEGLVKTAGAAERTRASFELMLGAEKGSQLDSFFDRLAKHTEFTGTRLKGLGHELLAVGMAANDIPRAMSAAVDMAAFSGNGDAGLADAIGTLSIIQRTGRVSDKQLGSMRMNIRDLYAQIAKDTGMGLDTVKKRMEAGTLKSEQVMESLFAAISGRSGKPLGGAGEAMSTLLGARFAKLKDLPSNFMEGLNRSPAMGVLSGAIGKVLGALDPESPHGARIAGALEAMVLGFANMLNRIDIPRMADLLERTFTALPPIVEKLIKMLEMALRLANFLIGDVTKPNEKAGGAVGTGGKTGAFSLPGETFGQKALNFAKGAFMSTAPAVQDRRTGGAFSASTPAAPTPVLSGPFYELGRGGAAGLASGLASGAPGVGAAATGLATAAKLGVTEPLAIRSPSKVFEGYGRMSGEGYARGLESTDARVDRALNRSVTPALALNTPAGRGAARDDLGGGMGPITMSVPITVNVTGAGALDAEDLAARIRDLVPGQLHAALDQLRVEMGAA